MNPLKRRTMLSKLVFKMLRHGRCRCRRRAGGGPAVPERARQHRCGPQGDDGDRRDGAAHECALTCCAAEDKAAHPSCAPYQSVYSCGACAYAGVHAVCYNESRGVAGSRGVATAAEGRRRARRRCAVELVICLVLPRQTMRRPHLTLAS